MNRSQIFALAARTERAYSAAQTFIANECPLLEQRLKTAALTAAINSLQFALTLIDWAIERSPETVLKIRIAQIEAKRFAVCQLIKIVQLDNRYQLTATARKLWNRKGAIAVSTLDRIFALN